MSNEGQNSTGKIDRQTTAFTQQADSPSTESSTPLLTLNPQLKMSAMSSPTSKTQDDSALRPLLQSLEKERSQGLKHIRTFSESSTESLSLPKKRKRRCLENSVPKLTRQKREHDNASPFPNSDVPALAQSLKPAVASPARPGQAVAEVTASEGLWPWLVIFGALGRGLSRDRAEICDASHLLFTPWLNLIQHTLFNQVPS